MKCTSPDAVVLRGLIDCYLPFLVLLCLNSLVIGGYSILCLPSFITYLGLVAVLVVFLILPPLQVLWALQVLWRPLPHRNEMEVRVPRKKMAGLYELVAKVARERRLTPPQEIRLAPDTIAHVYENDDGTEILVVGGLALRLFSQEALEGVIAHELAHFAAGDTRLLRQAARRGLLMAVLEWQFQQMHGASVNPLIGLIRLYHLVYRLFRASHSRGQEFAADKQSVAQAGAEETATAFLRVATVEHLPGIRLGDIAELHANLNLPITDIFGELERRAGRLAAADWKKACRKALAAPTGLFDAHPSLRARLEAIGVSSDRALRLVVATPGQPAVDLFADWPQVEKQLTNRFMIAVRELRYLKKERATLDML